MWQTKLRGHEAAWGKSAEGLRNWEGSFEVNRNQGAGGLGGVSGVEVVLLLCIPGEAGGSILNLLVS